MSNIYKIFRGVGDNNSVTGFIMDSKTVGSGVLARTPDMPGISFNKRYDEPTYSTFRVIFGQNSYNVSGATLLNTDYDRMPHPLFINQVVDATKTQVGNTTAINFDRNIYSTRDYLRDSNEFTREQMLQEFIIMWNDLQNNFPWYFQSIEGLDELLKINPEKGQRVGKDVRITFNMLEGIDHRISYLLNLYRKIAWDDTYQRWVLPDLMRFFDVQIYVTEFRTFHTSTISKPDVGVSNNGAPAVRKAFDSVFPNLMPPLYLKVLNGILPTYLIELQMCEFDLTSFDFSYRKKLSVADNPEMSSVSFKIKVGQINEITTYPLFSHFILNDNKINGLDRSKEFGINKGKSGNSENPLASGFLNDVAATLGNGKPYASTKDGDPRYNIQDQIAQNRVLEAQEHLSGRPYNESNQYQNIKNSSPNYSININDTNDTLPNTWIGNAFKFGKAYSTNFVTQKVDKAKMTNIPGLGFSFNDAAAAIQSKDFTSVLALIRRSIAQSIGSAGPSDLLEGKIDSTFKEFLLGLTSSEATSEDEKQLMDEASKTLKNMIDWNKVKDLSKATNLVSKGEVNIPVKIEPATIQKTTSKSFATINPINKNKGIIQTSIKSDATNTIQKDLGDQYVKINDKSIATNLDGGPTIIKASIVMEGTPSSATNNKKIENKLKTSPILSSGTNKKLTEKGYTTTVKSESTNESNLQSGKLTGNGDLGNKVDGGKLTGNGGLGNKADGGKFTGVGGLSNKTDNIELFGDGGLGTEVKGGQISGQGGLGTEVKGGQISGQGGLRKDIEAANFVGQGGLGTEVKGGQISGQGGLETEVKGGQISGQGGLGNSVDGGQISGQGDLGKDIDGVNFVGQGGLGDKVIKSNFVGQGGLGKTVIESEISGSGGLRNKIDNDGDITGQGHLGDKIMSDYKNDKTISEATDGDKLNENNKINQPDAGKATNNKI